MAYIPRPGDIRLAKHTEQSWLYLGANAWQVQTAPRSPKWKQKRLLVAEDDEYTYWRRKPKKAASN